MLKQPAVGAFSAALLERVIAPFLNCGRQRNGAGRTAAAGAAPRPTVSRGRLTALWPRWWPARSPRRQPMSAGRTRRGGGKDGSGSCCSRGQTRRLAEAVNIVHHLYRLQSWLRAWRGQAGARSNGHASSRCCRSPTTATTMNMWRGCRRWQGWSTAGCDSTGAGPYSDACPLRSSVMNMAQCDHQSGSLSGVTRRPDIDRFIPVAIDNCECRPAPSRHLPQLLRDARVSIDL